MAANFRPFYKHDGFCLVAFLMVCLMISQPQLIHLIRLRYAIEIYVQERALQRIVRLHQRETGAGHHGIRIVQRLYKGARQRGLAHAEVTRKKENISALAYFGEPARASLQRKLIVYVNDEIALIACIHANCCTLREPARQAAFNSDNVPA